MHSMRRGHHLRLQFVDQFKSSARAHSPVSVSLPSAGESSVALCYQLRTIDKVRLLKHTGELSADDMSSLEAAVKQVYGLS
ncbi:MAG: type II toxin-antitoxin system PemK/MazF family toxin [Limnohabitans sp.]|nr:type II toxin-antitoxin system PemK/MazF family toxin [Limnohabitans sp.]